MNTSPFLDKLLPYLVLGVAIMLLFKLFSVFFTALIGGSFIGLILFVLATFKQNFWDKRPHERAIDHRDA